MPPLPNKKYPAHVQGALWAKRSASRSAVPNGTPALRGSRFIPDCTLGHGPRLRLAHFGRKSALLTPSYVLVRLRCGARSSSQTAHKRVGLFPSNQLNVGDARLNAFGFAKLAGFLILLVWFGALGLIALNRQNLVDWWRLEHYHAPTSIVQLASQDTMTSYARKVFYVNRPAVENKDTFRKNCPNNGGEKTIVLGCYHSDQNGIFLLNVTDQRLNGVTQVTAAHEMLHAVYDRLSSGERKKVDAMLLDYYNHDLHDPRLRNTIAAYQKTEPHDVVNEMHSVFGTEVVKLPASLEQYYKRYFTNRSQIATYAAQYQAEFTSRQAAVSQADTQLANLKKQITSTESDLKTKQTMIDEQHNTLLTERDKGNISVYNAGVPAYNALVDAYNAQVQTVQDLVNQYNQLVVSRNAIALEEDQLANALNANVNPISR